MTKTSGPLSDILWAVTVTTMNWTRAENAYPLLSEIVAEQEHELQNCSTTEHVESDGEGGLCVLFSIHPTNPEYAIQ